MNALSPTGPINASNTATIGDNTQIEQIALGSHITQIKGFTADQVSALLAEIRAKFQIKAFDGRSPYVGLATFQEQDAHRFFGREKLTRVLVARVAAARFLVIAGPSGSGKSSLARAGLFPALKSGAVADSENWFYEILSPGRHPLVELGRVVASLTKNLSAGDELEQAGRTNPTLLHRRAEIALGDQRSRRLVLLIDQFEELFTQVTDETEQAAFVGLVAHALNAENGRVTIVCSTRSDFIGDWAAYPSLNAQLSRGVIQIPPMQSDELVSAIARPALQVGLQIDPDLVKQVLDDTQAAPGALPLMQFALDDLFQYESSKGGLIALTLDDYLERGGLQKALARHADTEFAKLNGDEQQIARTIFSGLIEPGKGTVDAKRTALFSELVPTGSDPSQTRGVLSKLADARLVITDQQDQHETVTLAHERLIDAWGWLRRLVDDNREVITLQNEIAEDAQEWETRGRSKDYLYGGARLATAQEEVTKKNIQLSGLAQEFVGAARRKHFLNRVSIIAGLILASGFFATIATLGITGELAAFYYPNLPMDWVDVPAGEFVMGITAADLTVLEQLCGDCLFQDEYPDHKVSLRAFRINRYEVTNQEYRQCVLAKICDTPKPAPVPPQDGDNYPVTGIKWQDAQEYCHRSSGRLPTEAEWEKAARGRLTNPVGGPIYPWGYEWSPSLANAGHGPDGTTTPIGSFEAGKSPYGIEDMAGNVYEWVADGYQEDYYRVSQPQDPTGPELADTDDTTWRVYRGGSFEDPPIDHRVTTRGQHDPSDPDPQIGFRCAQDLPRK